MSAASRAAAVGGAGGRSSRRSVPVDQLRLFEWLLVLFGLLIASGTFRSLLAAGADDREAGSILFQLITLSIYGSALVLLLRGTPAWFPRLALQAWPLILMTGLAVLSVTWSDVPSTTMRRAVALLLSTSFAFYVVSRFDLGEFCRILATAFSIFFVIAVLAALVSKAGVTAAGTHEGAWQALTGSKNEFGRSCGIALTFFIVMVVQVSPRFRVAMLVAVLAALAMLLLSTSKTPLTATVAGIGGTLLSYSLLHGRFGRFRIGVDIRVVVGVLLIPTIAFVVFWLVPFIVEAMGRDMTFSGRTELWKWAIAIGHDTPWLGSGYRGFWNDHNTRYFFESFAWDRTADGELSDSYSGPTHGHSGYVDLWLELGWCGVAVFALLIVDTFAKVARCLRRQVYAAGICLSALLWFLLAYAFTAKSILQQSEDLWFLFTTFYLYSIRECMNSPAPASVPVAMRRIGVDGSRV